MIAFIEDIKKYPKFKWHIVYFVSTVLISSLLKKYSPLFRDVFFTGAAFAYFIYITFFIDLVKLKLETKKRQLMTAFLGGAFAWMFVESLSKLFAKWAVLKFF